MASMMEKLDYLELMKEGKRAASNPMGYRSVKVAVLGDSTTQQLVQVLRAYLYRKGIFADVYEAEYDLIEQEVYNADSGLYRFLPDYVYIHTSVQKLRDRYYQRSGKGLEGFVKEHVAVMCHWWEAINERLSGRIIQNLYALPTERPFGNYTQKVQDAFYTVTKDINREIITASKEYRGIFLNDIEYLSSFIGKQQWFDEKLWIYAKLFCGMDHLPYVAKNIADVVLAGTGRAQKCLVLDLDNTLWGGIIGEDGLEGIEIGREGIGEAFYNFQHYLLQLKNRGIILAVCSKNDYDNAVQPFREHKGMVLREEDMAVFVANWNNKVDNIKYIAEKLNIGLDAVTFLDDSSFERNHVRTMLPEVTVPEMPEDPVNYVPLIDSLNLFETLSFSREDAKRAEYYRQQVERDTVRTKFTDVKDYLKSLEMKASFARFDGMHLPRIVQLIQRSNQFNLTTKRYNEKDCEVFMNDEENYFPAYVTLQDKYGDNGLIAVVILKIEGKKAMIDEWLMSCRVLCRGVEQFTMNKVVDHARSWGCTSIEGLYIPTAKNRMVEEFYGQFGFQKQRSDRSGTVWKLNVGDYIVQETWIEQIEEKECQAQLL